MTSRHLFGAVTVLIVAALAVSLTRIPFALLAVSAGTGCAVTGYLMRRTLQTTRAAYRAATASRDAYRASVAARDAEIARLRGDLTRAQATREPTPQHDQEQDTLTRDVARLRAMVAARDTEIARLRASERRAQDAAERWNTEYATLRSEVDAAWDAVSDVPTVTVPEDDGTRDQKRGKLLTDSMSGAHSLLGGDANGDDSTT